MLIQPKFSPPAGKTLLIVGQDVPVIKEYAEVVGGKPAGYAVYTSLPDLKGITESVDHGGGVQHAEAVLKAHPNAVLQIGLIVLLSGQRAPGDRSSYALVTSLTIQKITTIPSFIKRLIDT
jgi:hypothetical protein